MSNNVDSNHLVSIQRVVEYLDRLREQRLGAQKSSPNSWEVTFKIHLPDEFSGEITYPYYFLGDSLVWTPLPGEEADSPEGGIVIGMRWSPGFSETSMLGKGSAAQWEYLIYLDKNSPSRALGIYSDWAAEPDLMRSGQIQPQTECADLQGEL